MSALAARRAAQAAQASSAPVRSTARAKTIVAPTPAAQSPSIPSSDEEESVAEAGPSKRRKVSKGKSKPARYFAPVEDEDSDAPVLAIVKKKSKATRGRRFSPSAPASEADDGLDVDSSDEEGEEVSSAEVEVEEGIVSWTAPTTPLARPVTPAIREAASGSSSKFKAVSGSNFVSLSGEALNKCGIEGKGSGIVISLGRQDSIMLAGIYTLLPLQSPIDINSTTLSPSNSPYPVFAPSSHPIPIIAPASLASSSRRATQTSRYLSKLPLPTTFQQGETRTIFLIRENECGLTGLRNGVVPGFSNVWGEEKGIWGLRSVHPVLGSATTAYHPHVHPDSWTVPLQSLTVNTESSGHGHSRYEDDDDETDSKPLIALIKGPKRSGKSTFARAVLNNLLNRYSKVAWLECDLGQGEFSPGATVGLWIIDQPILGPPFTHPRIPERAHYLGSFSPQSCPDEYVAAIQHLVNHYTYEIANPLLSATSTSQGKVSSVVPLVINTQGWVKGLGEELLRSIEITASPTHVFSFEIDTVEDTTPHIHGGGQGHGNGWTSSPPPEIPYLTPYNTSSRAPIIHTLTSAPISPLLARHTPSDLRTLAMIAYFHSSLSSPTSPSWDFTRPLLAVPPYQVDLSPSGPLKRVLMSGEGGEAILPADLGISLNGNIIALAEINDVDPSGPIYDPSAAAQSLEEITYLGLALVRGLKAIEPRHRGTADVDIDVNDDQGYTLHLLTPLPEEILSRANCIVRNGAVELPLCGMLDWRAPNAPDLAGVKWEDVPYLDVSGVVGVGGERRRFRRNLMRKGM